MYRLLETIRIVNGKMMNLSYHEDRINHSLKFLYGKRELPPLKSFMEISTVQNSGVYKYSMLYSNTDYEVQLVPYIKRNIQKLLLLENPEIAYDLKYSDRSIFMNLLPDDEINTEIIFTRKGFLTDTRYTNIALLKEGRWITPQIPLLEGTQRARLIKKSIIQTGQINQNHLNEFSKIRIFNALMPWGDCIELDISKISYYD